VPCGADPNALAGWLYLSQMRGTEIQLRQRAAGVSVLKAGTIFHKSRTPLVKPFLAIYLLTQSKNDIAALELARQLGVKWDTAWLNKQKLMETMRQRNRRGQEYSARLCCPPKMARAARLAR
jgi:hypothetical protein